MDRLLPGTIKILAILESKSDLNSEDCSDDLLNCEEGESSGSTAITGEHKEESALEESTPSINEEEDDDADMSNILDYLT